MMTRKQWKIIIGIYLLIIVLVLSPFLPGPSFMSRLTNMFFNLTQLGSILGLLLIPFGLFWTYKQSYNKEKEGRTVLPILLWTIPILMIILSIWVAGVARNISRTIAINNSEKLILAIEKYKETNKQYPKEISQLTPDFIKTIPIPWIMGISGYNYEKKESSFNLTFSQNVVMGFNFEVVVYDPTENHKAEGKQNDLYDTGKKGWKYYIYD
ncbi:MAG: hypothetical protein WC150_00790 [Bacteroidia bacterium]